MTTLLRRAAFAATIALLSAAPSQAQEAPDGLYLMTRFWMNSGLETDAFLFWDGQVVRGPAGDIEDFDFEAARRCARPGRRLRTVGRHAEGRLGRRGHRRGHD